MANPDFDIHIAHRWFAVEFNNRAWELIERATRSEAETQRMIHAAHAACLHWLEVGSSLNHQRALCLLATACAAAGQSDEAVRYASRCLDMSKAAGHEQTPFDRASALGCAARASACSGRPDEAARLLAEAQQVVAAFNDPEDRRVFDALYGAADGME